MERYSQYVRSNVSDFKQEEVIREKVLLVILFPFFLTIGGLLYSFGVNKNKSDEISIISLVTSFFGVILFIIFTNLNWDNAVVHDIDILLREVSIFEWIVAFGITALILLVISRFYKWARAGGIYYLQHPMAKVLDERSATGKLENKDIMEAVKKVDLGASKSQQANQLKKILDSNS